ncbi:MAG: hypothetical protein QXI16_05110 [Sulfolobaceae archaeon]
MPLDPLERELLRAAVRCYRACGEGFEETVRMISEARGLDPEFTKRVLMNLKNKYKDDKEYLELRAQLPEDFPI